MAKRKLTFTNTFKPLIAGGSRATNFPNDNCISMRMNLMKSGTQYDIRILMSEAVVKKYKFYTNGALLMHMSDCGTAIKLEYLEKGSPKSGYALRPTGAWEKKTYNANRGKLVQAQTYIKVPVTKLTDNSEPFRPTYMDIIETGKSYIVVSSNNIPLNMKKK